MVINAIKKALKRLNEVALYGNRRQKKLSEFDFKMEVIKSKDFAPVFFLSTGRTGTEFFTKLLEKSDKVKVFHSPSDLFCDAQSELIEQGRVSYEIYKKLGFDDDIVNNLVSQILMAAREDLLYKTFLHDKVYIETNNRVTFLAPAIKHIFPNAKFVYLYRHPGEFIRSGVRRGYYTSKGTHETGRLVPIKQDQYFDKWKKTDNIEKIAWLWNETNCFIDDYLKTLDNSEYFQFNFNNLSKNSVSELLNFLDIDDISIDDIANSIQKPTNIQKTGSFPKYDKWQKNDKQKVKDICGVLSAKYGYKL